MKIFNDFPDAFDYCREADKPVIVSIKGHKYQYRLFPSGRCEQIDKCNDDQIAEINPELYNRLFGDLPTRFRLRQELDNLFDEIVDNIIRTSDKDILEEVKEDYGDPSFLADKCRQMLKLAKIKANIK